MNSAGRLYEHSWADFTRASGVGVADELHAMYLKACQKKQQDERYTNDPNAWPWVMAMWPHQPDPFGNLWVPGVRIGWALADPPETMNQIGTAKAANQRIKREMPAATRPALEGVIVD
jgi:hypothetical protein